MTYRLIPRSEWGARYGNGTGARKLPATEAWLHHSVTIAPDLVAPFGDDYEAIRTLEKIGQDRFGAGISYTRCVTPAGLVFEGHSIDRIGTHTQNHNTVGVGYCLVGNYDLAAMTAEQERALAWCLQEDCRRGWLDAPKLDGGHRDLKATACPGGLAYPRIPAVNSLAAGPPVTDTVAPAVLKRMDTMAYTSVTVGTIGQSGYHSGVRFDDGLFVDLTTDGKAVNSVQDCINKGLVPSINCDSKATFDQIAATA